MIAITRIVVASTIGTAVRMIARIQPPRPTGHRPVSCASAPHTYSTVMPSAITRRTTQNFLLT